MYQESPHCESPSDDAILWRYIDFTKFVSLLDKSSLFFDRADKLGDPFEGAFSGGNREMRSIPDADEVPKYPYKAPDYFLPALVHIIKGLRRFTLISCWHERSHESAFMWSSYARETDGVAIKTDFGSLTNSLTDSQDIYVGKVNYVDYEHYFIPEDNFLSPFLHKRQDFSHEQEVRAIVSTIPLKDNEIDFSQDIWDIGEYYEVDLSLLIKQIVVAPLAPDWFLELIQSVVVKRYKLEVPIVRSNLAQKPIWDTEQAEE